MRKLEALKVGVQRGKKKKKTRYVSWKAYFASFVFFITPFHLQFKDDFKSMS
jgi:hypothetical protein